MNPDVELNLPTKNLDGVLGKSFLFNLTDLLLHSFAYSSLALGSGGPLSSVWAGLSFTKNVTTLTHDGQHYSNMALANLFNDKFIAVESSLPYLN